MLFNELVEKIQPFLNESILNRKPMSDSARKKALKEIRAMYAKEEREALERSKRVAKERVEEEQARAELARLEQERAEFIKSNLARSELAELPQRRLNRAMAKVDKKPNNLNKPKKPKMLGQDELAKLRDEAAKRRDDIMSRIMDEIRGTSKPVNRKRTK